MMRFSEAIRLGATLRPQAYGRLFDRGRSCAIGAAYEAAGVSDSHSVLPEGWFDFLIRQGGQQCVECGELLTDNYKAISHMNDFHFWTRERIADFVETLEAIYIPEEFLYVRSADIA